MGIKDLTKLITENAPDAKYETTVSHITDRIVAIDASLSMY